MAVAGPQLDVLQRLHVGFGLDQVEGDDPLAVRGDPFEAAALGGADLDRQVRPELGQNTLDPRSLAK